MTVQTVNFQRPGRISLYATGNTYRIYSTFGVGIEVENFKTANSTFLRGEEANQFAGYLYGLHKPSTIDALCEEFELTTPKETEL